MNKIFHSNYYRVVKENVIGFLSVLLAISFLLMEMTPFYFIKKIVSLLVLLFILISIFNLKGTIAKIVYILMGMTFIILIGNKNIMNTLMEGALVNLPIVCIFVLTPLLGISIKVGGYIESLRYLLGRFKNSATFFYIVFLILTHLFSVLLNIGSILINLHLMESSNVRSKRLIANALNRGYTTITVWSPYLGVMVLVVSQLKIEWFTLVSYTVGFVLLSLIIAVLVEVNVIRHEEIHLNKLSNDSSDFEEIIEGKLLKIVELFVLLVFSMGLILIIDKFTNISIVLAIAFVSLLFPLIWCLLKGIIRRYKNEVIMHATKTLPNLKTEFTLFLVAGIFSYAFVQSPLNEKSTELLNLFFGQSSLLMAIALSSVIILTGILGLHPVVMLTIFATSIDPEQIGLSSLYFAALLLGSAGIANTISPATAVNNLVSNTLGVEIFTVSFKWNWIYALILFIALPVYLLVVGV